MIKWRGKRERKWGGGGLKRGNKAFATRYGREKGQRKERKEGRNAYHQASAKPS